jgi:hypothetical protein
LPRNLTRRPQGLARPGAQAIQLEIRGFFFQ